VVERINRADRLQHARSTLRDADPVLARLIDDRPDFDPDAWLAQLPPMDLYGALLFQVVGQQLSVVATRRILARIEALFDGASPPPPSCSTSIRSRSAPRAYPGGRSPPCATSPNA